MIQTVEVVPAQGMTAVSRQAHLRALRNNIEKTWLQLAATLRDAYDKNDWSILGYRSFSDYVEDTLRVSRSEAYDLVRIARLQERYPDLTPRLLDAGKSNVRQVLPQIKNDDDANLVEQWVDAAAVNTWRELKAVIHDEPPARKIKRVEIMCGHCGVKEFYAIEI